MLSDHKKLVQPFVSPEEKKPFQIKSENSKLAASNPILDKAFYCWAVMRLNPDATVERVKLDFEDLKHGITGRARRTLNVLLPLLSKNLQKLYQRLSKQEFDKLSLEDLIKRITEAVSSADIDSKSEAQCILTVFSYESNLAFTNPNHTLQEQVETLYLSYVVSEMEIERFNRFKSEMHFNLSKDKLDDYLWASKLSDDNILLLGIQLSTCAILYTQFTKFNLLNLPLATALKEKKIRSFLSQFTRNEKYSAAESDMSHVLMMHGTPCEINDVSVQGSSFGMIAAQFVKSLGTQKLLEIADQFCLLIREYFDPHSLKKMTDKIENLIAQSQHEHVVVNVDLNGTIMGPDKANGTSLPAAVNAMLGEASKYKTKWGDEQKEDKMTHREFVDKYKLKGDHRDQVLKKARKTAYANFLNDARAIKHPQLEKIENDYAMLIKQLSKYNLFESFIGFIEFLQKNNKSFTLILRTFGEDLEDVVKEIHGRTSLRFELHGKFDGENFVTESGSTLTSDYDVSTVFNHFHCAVRDHYDHWNDHGQRADFAKPFYVDKHHPNVTSIIFDDNFVRNIIRAYPVGCENPIQQHVSLAKLKKMGQVVNVETYEAATNLRYFIDHYEFALQKKSQKASDEKDSSHQKQVVIYRGNLFAFHSFINTAGVVGAGETRRLTR